VKGISQNNESPVELIEELNWIEEGIQDRRERLFILLVLLEAFLVHDHFYILYKSKLMLLIYGFISRKVRFVSFVY